jgi:hypothetical protein
VGNGIEKAVLLFIAADLAHKKDGINYQPGNDHGEENDAQHQRHHVAPVVYQPDDVEINRQPHQAGAQRDEKCDCPGAASDAHDVSGKL